MFPSRKGVPPGAISEFGTVQPLVFGHFGEINSRFQTLIDELVEVVTFLFVSLFHSFHLV